MFSSRFFKRALRVASRVRFSNNSNYSNNSSNSSSYQKLGSLAAGVALYSFSTVVCNDDHTKEVVLGNADEIHEGGMKKYQIGDNENNFIIVSQVCGNYYATGGRCSHYGAPLQMGFLDGYNVICPWHAAAFDVRTGEMVEAPGMDAIPTYKVSVKEGKLVAHIPESRLAAVAGTLNNKRFVKRDLNDQRVFVVVGGGAAGATAVETLRREGYTGRIVLVSSENVLPYDRVPLCKNFKMNSNDLVFRSKDFYDEYGIEVELSSTVTSVDSAQKSLQLSTGKSISYNKLLLATGSAARVPGPLKPYLKAFSNVFTLRSAEDHSRFSASLASAQDVVIVGSGFIGLEAAKSIKSTWPEKNVTVIGTDPRPLAGVLGPEIANQVLLSQRLGGINFYLDQTIDSFEGENGKVTRVVVPTRKSYAMAVKPTDIKADIVLLATGSQLTTNYVPAHLANVDGSVRVNSHFQTEDPSIWAAGDIAQFPSLLSEGRERVEHWAVAQQQGRLAAMNMLEKGNNYLEVPFFWTNQFLNVQFAGFANGHNWTFTETKQVSETEEKVPKITYFFKDERCIGVAAANWPGAVLRLKIALQRGLMPTRKELTSGQVNYEVILEKVKGSNPCGPNCCRKA